MTIVGLTGGSGSGKGYVASLLARRGIPSLDTDIVSREVCAPGMPCTLELAEHFGDSIILRDGSLNRRALAELAFPDPEKKASLNRITHRHILARCEEWLSEMADEGCPAAVIDAPQLFEAKFDARCDIIIAVIAPTDVRVRRIIKRDGITEQHALNRISAQLDEEFYRAHADIIIENGGGDVHGEDNGLAAKVDAAADMILSYNKGGDA